MPEFFPQPGDRGAPARTSSAGSRGLGCSDVSPAIASEVEPNDLPDDDLPDELLTALLPPSCNSTFIGPQAMLWIYLPSTLYQAMTPDKAATLSLQSLQTGDIIYQEQLSLTHHSEGSIIQITLPATLSSGEPLVATQQKVRWSFTAICDSTKPIHITHSNSIGGTLQRIAPNQSSLSIAELEQAKTDKKQQAELYAKAGIWQEALTMAAALKATDASPWRELLTSANLASLADYPLVQHPEGKMS
ncbi:MAG: DUF928 domain-containing protein [Cyanobacteria bacterium P01_F01_bin.53]